MGSWRRPSQQRGARGHYPSPGRRSGGLSCAPLMRPSQGQGQRPSPGPCIPWTRLLGGAAKAREGQATVHLLDRAAEAEAVPLKSTYWAGWPGQREGRAAARLLHEVTEAAAVSLQEVRRAVPPSASWKGWSRQREGQAAVHLPDGAAETTEPRHQLPPPPDLTRSPTLHLNRPAEATEGAAGRPPPGRDDGGN